MWIFFAGRQVTSTSTIDTISKGTGFSVSSNSTFNCVRGACPPITGRAFLATLLQCSLQSTMDVLLHRKLAFYVAVLIRGGQRNKGMSY